MAVRYQDRVALASKRKPAGARGLTTFTSKPEQGVAGKFAEQMLKRYTINPITGAAAVAKDTVMGGEAAFKPAPKEMNMLFPALGPSGNAILYNMIENEKFSDATAPTDFIGLGVTGIAKAIPRIVGSKTGKAGIASLVGAEAAGARDTEEAKAWSPKHLITAARENPSILKSAYDALPTDLVKSLEEAARRQNSYTAKKLSEKRGEVIDKAKWFADGVGIKGEDMWNEATSFFNNNPGFVDESGNLTQEGINLAEALFTGSRGRSLQWSHITPLEAARNAAEPFIAQGPGKAIFTYPRVNRLMGSENMVDWAKNLAAPVTRSSILKQLGM